MRAVSRFEANLLRVLHALLQHTPIQPALIVLAKPQPRPLCLSRDAVELIQDALAKGIVHFLARHGWQRERFPRADQVAEGRLWQRTAPPDLALVFSGHSLEFLIQLLAGTWTNQGPPIAELTIADRLLLLLTFDALRGQAPGDAIAKRWLAFHQDGLCRLAFPAELIESKRRYRIDWSPWLSGLGSAVLESLQSWLADRWGQAERRKEDARSPSQLQEIGANQHRVYCEYLDAIDVAQRRDLARAFLQAAAQLLRDRPHAERWISSVFLGAVRLADRAALGRDAFAILLQLERLHDWQQEALGIGYFDEGYQVSQLWKAEWERLEGDQLVATARRIRHEADPMNSASRAP